MKHANHPSPPSPPAPDSPTPQTLRAAALVGLVTLITRLVYWPSGIVGKDGLLYIHSLSLDGTFNVPMPGNIGWVLLGKAFTTLGLHPVDAFVLVSVLISIVGTVFFFLLSSLLFGRALAVATALAFAHSPLVWYHAQTIMSYEVWVCVPPAIAYFGLRFIRERRLALLWAAALATGLGTILRPDMVVFGGPLLGGILLFGRAPIVRGWLACAGVCALCCALWFFGTALVLGGVNIYIEKVRAQSEFFGSFGAAHKGLVEGLMRNGAKYALFVAWGGLFAVIPAAIGLGRLLRRPWANRLPLVLGALALAPSLYFGLWLFMGNAGLALPTIAILFLLAAQALSRLDDRRRSMPTIAMAAIGLAGAVQFAFTPLLPERTQRDAIFNVVFARYSGPALRALYDFNLPDFGIDSSLSNTLRQLRNPEPIPNPHPTPNPQFIPPTPNP